MRPLPSISAFICRLCSNERGNFAMMFGLMAIPLLGIVGLGIDLTRAYIVQVRLQGAVDNAALAAATLRGQPDDKIIDFTKKYFASNYKSDFWAPALKNEPKVTIDKDGTVHVTAQANMSNYFLRLFGEKFNSFDIAVGAEAVGEAHGLEVALVLDITSSMLLKNKSSESQTRLQAMKDAANSLVDILFGDETVHDKLKIAVIPFAASVRVDPNTAITKGWVDTAGNSSVARLNFSNAAHHNYGMYSVMNGMSWQGCLEARPGGLEETDTAPSSAAPDTLWVPYFSPDNPDIPVQNISGITNALLALLGLSSHNCGGGASSAVCYPNDYLSDGSVSGLSGVLNILLGRQKNSSKYTNKSAPNDFGATKGPNHWCVRSDILPLTNKKATIQSKINGLVAEGFTAVPLGAGWGWRALSPTEPYTEGAAYTDGEWTKALIILTDGNNQIGDEEDTPDNGTMSVINGTTYTAYGFGKQYRVDNTTDTQAKMETALDSSLTRTCNNIKAVKKDGKEAITIYTITFGDDVNNGNIGQVMKGCASEPVETHYYHAPSNAELKTSFEAIGTELSKIRLTK